MATGCGQKGALYLPSDPSEMRTLETVIEEAESELDRSGSGEDAPVDESDGPSDEPSENESENESEDETDNKSDDEDEASPGGTTKEGERS